MAFIKKDNITSAGQGAEKRYKPRAVHTTLAAQRVGLRSQKKNTQALRQRGQAGETKQVHTSPATQTEGPRNQNQCTPALQCRGQAWGAETSAHKPHNPEGGPRKPREVHTNPMTQRVSSAG